MEYHFIDDNGSRTIVPMRRVDAHSLLHQRATKAAKACDAADAADGFIKLQNLTLRVVAVAWGVSVGSVARARCLTPEQRDAVRRGERPLVLPQAPAEPLTLPAAPPPPNAPATPSVPPVTAGEIVDARDRLNRLVKEIGIDAVLNLLATTEIERVAA
jgi:hypothetical protein